MHHVMNICIVKMVVICVIINKMEKNEKINKLSFQLLKNCGSSLIYKCVSTVTTDQKLTDRVIPIYPHSNFN